MKDFNEVYDIIDEDIGHGGFANVMKVQHKISKKLFAVKKFDSVNDCISLGQIIHEANL